MSYVAAFVFGTLIGAERQYRQRTAGLRTNTLVALGSAASVDLGQRLGGMSSRSGSSPRSCRGSASSARA
ncbi:MgtC/SapB family protein [Sphingomonas sp. HMP9]|uniref:MgtC/SapB family protein n=1 Tax=Sphingomonas sp. HMP9 TaxID=1517554 RepID=UPI0022B2A41D|nr:MgtC/SapB family protein [Sphingomonas sp. HMP9]